MARKGNNKPKNKPKNNNRLTQRAIRDVNISAKPALNAVDRAEAMSQQDYLRGTQAARSTYGGFQRELNQMPSYGEMTQGLVPQLQSQFASLSGALGGGGAGVPGDIYGLPVGLPEGEMQAGQAMGTAIGAGSLGTLASQSARNAGYQSSAAREGNLAQRSARENLIQQMNDLTQQYANRRLDVTDLMPEQILARKDELRQQALENKMAKSKLASDEAFSQWLQGYLGSQGKNDGKGSGGGGKGGGGKGGGGNGFPEGMSGLNRPPNNSYGQTSQPTFSTDPYNQYMSGVGQYGVTPPGYVAPSPGWDYPVAQSRPDWLTNPYDLGLVTNDDPYAFFQGGW